MTQEKDLDVASEGVPYGFKKYGEVFSMMMRNRDVVMYRRYRNGKLTGFEVLMIRYRHESKIGDNVIKAGECLPSSSQWGTFGWSFLKSEEKKALDKFASCCKPAVSKEEKRVATVNARKSKKIKAEPKPERRIVRRIKR